MSSVKKTKKTMPGFRRAGMPARTAMRADPEVEGMARSQAEMAIPGGMESREPWRGAAFSPLLKSCEKLFLAKKRQKRDFPVDFMRFRDIVRLCFILLKKGHWCHDRNHGRTFELGPADERAMRAHCRGRLVRTRIFQNRAGAGRTRCSGDGRTARADFRATAPVRHTI